MPFGIVILLVLIFLIACCLPGFLSMLFTLLGIALGLCLLWKLIDYFIVDKFKARAEERERVERERAIDEWERKWGRRHPTRK